MNIPLSTFPAPLLRLILCGGEGLPPVWGPVLQAGSQVLGCGDPNYGRWAWDAVLGAAVRPDRAPKYLLDNPDGWSLPLDDDSPWSARLAMAAAYLTWLDTSPKVLLNPPEFDMLAASTDLVFDEWEKGRVVALTRLAHRGPLPSVHTWKWSAKTGFCWGNGPRLPTLPEHLQTHSPAVVLLLALYDVPEIRARVESA